MVGRSCRAVARTATTYAFSLGWVAACGVGMLAYWLVSGTVG